MASECRLRGEEERGRRNKVKRNQGEEISVFSRCL